MCGLHLYTDVKRGQYITTRNMTKLQSFKTWAYRRKTRSRCSCQMTQLSGLDTCSCHIVQVVGLETDAVVKCHYVVELERNRCSSQVLSVVGLETDAVVYR